MSPRIASGEARPARSLAVRPRPGPPPLGRRSARARPTRCRAPRATAAPSAPEAREREPAGVEREQVGEVGDGQEQRRELARCEPRRRAAWGSCACAAAVTSTIGVSRTTVASRLGTAVTAAATANTSPSSRAAAPRAHREQRADRVEEPLPPAALGEHEQRGEEATVGPRPEIACARRRRPSRPRPRAAGRPQRRRAPRSGATPIAAARAAARTQSARISARVQARPATRDHARSAGKWHSPRCHLAAR